MEKIKILYIPYAGGSAQLCKTWKYYLNPNIEVYPIELAGRGTRFKDNFYSNINEAIKDLLSSITPYVDEPYVIYGHSFGALLTYELYYKIREVGIREPEYLFFSGCLPPNRRDNGNIICELLDNDFLNEVIKFNGMEKEVLENKELMNIILPILRADFRLMDMYKYKEKDKKIDKDVCVLYGNDMTYEQMKGWRDLTNKSIKYEHIDGDHFFVKKNTEEVLNIVIEQIRDYKVDWNK